MYRPGTSALPRFALAAALLGPAPAAAVKLPSFLVAYTGQGAPGTAGPTFELLFTPSISELGDLGFRARLTGPGTNSGNNFGLWRTEGGPLLLHLRAGDAVPGLAGTTWGTNFSDPNLQSAPGETLDAFTVQLNGTTSGASIWSELPAGLRKVAVLGESAPEIAGATFALLGAPLFNGASETLFGARVTGGGVVAANDDALYLDDGATLDLLVRQGDLAPDVGMAAPFLSDFAGVGGAVLADGGVVSFPQSVNLSGFLRNGIWSNHGGALHLVAIDKGSAAGIGGTEHLNSVSTLRGNRHGQISFLAVIQNQFDGNVGNGLWISDEGGAPALALRRDGAEPGLSPNATRFTLADNGVLYLITTLFENPSGSHDGIFALTRSAGWRELVRVGERVPDLPAGIEYASFDQIVANGNGQIAFRALITGPGVVSSNNRVLAAQGSDLSFRLVARTGEQIEVSPGVFRTISTLNLTHTGSGGDGAARGISNDGGLPWLAGTGGTSAAILVANMGIPPNVQLVGLEAVQVVQDWNGSVPLVEGKRTLLRAHLQSASPATVEPVLRARPSGGGAELPFSPAFASNPGGTVRTSVLAASDRDDLQASAFFEVPFEWTLLGDVEFEVELLGRPLDCVEAAGPTPHDCKVRANFVAVDQPQMSMVSVDYFHNGVLQTVGAARRLDLVQRWLSALPVRSIDWTQSDMPWPVLSPPRPDTFDVRAQLRVWRMMTGCFDFQGCPRIYFGAIAVDDIDGIGDTGGTASTAYMNSNPLAEGRHSHTHEIGHNLGVGHAADALLGEVGGYRLGQCNEKAKLTQPYFPHFHDVAGQRRPTLGPMSLGENSKVFGWDSLLKRVVAPDGFFELMSYCRNPGVDRWPSKHTYEIFRDAINGRFSPGSPREAADGAWGAQEYLLIGGSVDSAAPSGSFQRFLRLASAPNLPAPAPGSLTLRVHRAGSVVQDTSFEPEPVEADGQTLFGETFLIPVALAPEIESVELLQGATLLASRAASAAAPTVAVVSPNGGEVFSGPTVTVTWTASDADADALDYAVQFSADAGATWRPLATNAVGNSLEVDRALLAGTSAGMIRVLVTDGLRTGLDVSDALFTVEDNDPAVAIVAPDGGALFYQGQTVSLAAMALDPEDGVLSGSAIEWTSDLSGALGAGEALTVEAASLATGLHLLTVTAEDSQGNLATAQRTIRIDQPALLFEDDFESAGLTLWSLHP